MDQIRAYYVEGELNAEGEKTSKGGSDISDYITSMVYDVRPGKVPPKMGESKYYKNF